MPVLNTADVTSQPGGQQIRQVFVDYGLYFVARVLTKPIRGAFSVRRNTCAPGAHSSLTLSLDLLGILYGKITETKCAGRDRDRRGTMVSATAFAVRQQHMTSQCTSAQHVFVTSSNRFNFSRDQGSARHCTALETSFEIGLARNPALVHDIPKSNVTLTLDG